ncbi:MAG: PilN domain-containing protein [Proteobacteria bacterium]|nr:PilN domain-containing protein [Pseudomonadota bacterium]
MTDLAARLIAVIGGFFAWWFKELAGLVPAPLRGALEGSTHAALLDLSGPEIVLSRLSGGSWRELGRVDPRGLNEPAQASAFAGLIKKAKLGELDVVLRLPASMALCKTLSLPLAAEENLRQVLTFEMDRHTPFSADEVYFDYRVRNRDAETGRMEVELVTVPRKVMDERCERAAAWGVVPDIVDIGGEVRGGEDRGPEDFTDGINLLPADDGVNGGQRVGGLTLILATVAAALVAVAVYLPLEAQQGEMQAISAALAKAKAEAGAAMELREEIDRLVAESQFLVTRKQKSVKATEVLDELTNILPDGTWLRQFKIKDRELRISGFSQAASNLIGLIEQSSMFENARFTSPVTQDRREGLERFNVAADLAQGPPLTGTTDGSSRADRNGLMNGTAKRAPAGARQIGGSRK